MVIGSAAPTSQATTELEKAANPTEQESDVAIAPPKVAQPPMYAVLLLNDDYTPMDFVVFILERFFGLGMDRATEIMLNVHYKGKGVAGVFPRDIAITKAKMVNDFSRQQGHPLLCQVEKAD